MGLVQTVAPTTSVLSVDEAKAQARIDYRTDDSFVESLVSRATRYCENVTKRQFAAATWQLTLDCFPTCIYVPRPPLTAVSSITYVDTEGSTQTLATSKYRVDTNSEPGRITEAYLESWPTTREVTEAVTVTFTAGYSTIPDDLKHAVAMLVAYWYEQRESVVIGTITKEVEFSVMGLLDYYIMSVYR